MRVFDSKKNLMEEVLEQMESEVSSLPSFYTDDFRSGVRWAIRSLRYSCTNNESNGIIIGEAELIRHYKVEQLPQFVCTCDDCKGGK